MSIASLATDDIACPVVASVRRPPWVRCGIAEGRPAAWFTSASASSSYLLFFIRAMTSA